MTLWILIKKNLIKISLSLEEK